MYQVQWHICEDNTDMKLQWNQIDWKKAEEQVNRLQIRIVKATLEQKLRLVKRLQYLITNSFYAKALAVKRVVSNRGKKTPGIDGEFWKSDKEKVNAVRSLDCQTYHAKPLKRVINVNIKMYIFDHLRMYIFAILPLDRYIFLSDKIFL